MKPNILYVSPFFYPEKISSAKYNKYLVDNLKRKINVDVFCMHPFYPDWYSKKVNNFKDVYRPNWLPNFPKSMLKKRLLLEVGFFLHSLKFLVLSKKKYDCIVCVSPPSLFLIISLFYKKSILIVHDLQSVHSAKSHSKTLFLISSVINHIEKLFFSFFKNKIFLSYEMLNKVNLPNSNVFYPPITINKNYVISNNNFNCRSIIYSGALGEKQNPILLLDLLKKFINKNNNFHVHIYSSGDFFNHCKLKFSCENIHFHNLVDEKDLFSLYNNDAIHIIPQKKGTSSCSLPSKISNLIYCNSKTLTITDSNSELDQIMKNYKNNLSVYNWDYRELSINIMKLSQQKRENTEHGFIKNFHISEIVNHIVQYIKN